ncbi:capsule biosynthesis protein CapC [Shewanella olleyana]|uniref:tyrosine-protein phosphatase n=1 Tax=Shewanella olleyana TaxID=135626 RepID=UPI0020109F73|nr:CpsB/CapC family capsule biosynthesis tyrosine phosphatase [Shewanella olleyana]MCL1065356.1 capsule biosynthesis protein CapC [Shewanella olleyana]
MIDIHCHVLPEIDDGAKSLDESMALIHQAIEQGITRIVATPHIHVGIYDNNQQTILGAYSRVQQEIKAQGLPIELRVAAEVRICPEIIMLAKQNQLPFVGDFDEKKVLLLELPSSHLPAGVEKLIDWLINSNILPMIAHPERNRELQRYPDRIKPFQQRGCLFQLTAASLIGDLGDSPKALSQLWIKKKLYTIIGSDCHSIKRRPPKLHQAYSITKELTDDTYATQLVVDNPYLISKRLFS